MKKRVKCVNCGMIYDILIPDIWRTDPPQIQGMCPKCHSNAFDDLGLEENWRYE